MDFCTLYDWNALSESERKSLLQRPAVTAGADISRIVTGIVNDIRARGDEALREYTARFDRTDVKTFRVSEAEIEAAEARLSEELKSSMKLAASNIERFHTAEKLAPVQVETMPGVLCEQTTRPIQSVGLYVPGGTAPLFSTVMMLAIPAKIAGCERIVLMSPPKIADAILYAARLCGVTEIYQGGGAQAIAAMAFGTESIPKVDKIFGPGNAFVTEAKRQASQSAEGAAIDMPAGPSEVLVIADEGANPEFVAADLLSQAEHGPDSQVILVTPSEKLAREAGVEAERQLVSLPRRAIAEKALSASRIILSKDLCEAVDISNRYAPEHLIIAARNARELVRRVTHAGSVFLGDWSCESAGDYASGTNHVLPTYGYAATYSSLGLADFQKRMTVQELSRDGIARIGRAIEVMAAAESLNAHERAVTVRLKKIREEA